MTHVRYALRTLLRAPCFASVAVVTLALGIGANAAIYSVARAVLLAPLPWHAPDRAVTIWSRWAGWDKTWVSEAELLDFRGARSLEAVGGWSTGQVNLTGDGAPERVGAAQVTPNLFRVLGVQPLLGRGFTEDEEVAGRDTVVILGHELWQQRYAGDARIVGRRIRVDGAALTVVGVMPRGFRLPTDYSEDYAEPTRLWLPLPINHAQPERGNHGYYAAGRLRRGVAVEQAQAELQTIIDARTREGLYPPQVQQGALAVRLDREILGEVRPRVVLLAGAVAFLLLIACANVANLLLARAEGRVREIALRTAIGADRGRLVRQLLTESLMLALSGAAAGIALAWTGVRLLTASAPGTIPRIHDAQVDWRVALFALALATATSLLFGMAPILRLLRLNLVDSLKEGGHSATVGASRLRVRNAIVAAEMALALVLLVGAGLTVRTLWALQQVDLGFDPKGVLTARVALPPSDYPEPANVVAFYERLVERVRALPGVARAGAVRSLPLGATIGDWGLTVEGYTPPPGSNAKGDWQVVTPGAFEAMGERLVAGRFFDARDRSDTQPVAIVNETMARAYWGGRSPLGRRLRQGGSRSTSPWVTVVGVVGDLRHNGIVAPVKEKFYRPHSQFHLSTGFAPRNMTLVMRTDGDPTGLVGPVRAAVAEIDPNVPAAGIRPMTEVVSDSMAATSFTGLLLALFAVVALALSAIGLYGVLAYLVSQRTREIGIRIALGASQPAVLRLVVRQGLVVSGAGVLLGIGGAVAVARVMASVLYGVRPADPLTLTLVPVALLAVALLASLLPAWRAARVEPVVALREE